MAEERQGRVVLEGAAGAEVRRRVIEFLLRHARDADREQLERGLRRLPAMLTRPMGERQAERIAEALRGLGAEATVWPVVPASSLARREVPPPPERPVAPPSTAADPSPVRRGPAFLHVGGRRQLAMVALLLIVVGVVLGSDVLRYRLLLRLGLVDTVEAVTGRRVVTENEIHGSWYYTRGNADDAPPAAPGTITAAALVREAEAPFRVPADRRLTAGMVEGVRAFSRLFAPQAPLPEVSEQSEPLGEGRYRITLTEGAAHYPLELSNRPPAVAANLTAVEAAFAKLLAGDGRDALSHHLADQQAVVGAEVYFDYGRLIEHSLDLDQALRSGEQGAGALLGLSRQWAWAALFKQPLFGGENAELAARQALAYYLLGATFAPAAAAEVRPTLLLALGYPDAALRQLERDGRQDYEARLLRAYITRDVDGLAALWASGEGKPRLNGFLLAAACYDTELTERARALFDLLADAFPEARPLQLYYGARGSVAQNRRGLTDYPLDVVEDHLVLAQRLFDLSAVTAEAGFETLARSQVDSDDAAEKWVAVHQRLFADAPHLKRGGALLAAATLGRWLRGEMAEALYYRHQLESRVLSRGAEARKWRERVARIYGDSPLTRTLTLMEHHQQGDYQAVRSGRDDGRLAAATGMELEADVVADLKWLRDVVDYPYRLRMLERLHQRLLPNAEGWRRLAGYYRQLLLRPLAARAERNAIALFPSDPAAYVEWLKDDGAAAEAAGVGPVERQPWVLVALGNRRWDAGDKAAAEARFREALRLAPEDSAAYWQLGELLEGEGRLDEAAAVWNRYLENGDQSLTGGRAAGHVADIYLKQGKIEEALALWGEAKENGSGGAMNGFARASEAAGNVLEAERWFQQAAERYPTSVAPGRLAVFYLRQGDRASALKVLRAFRRYNRDDLYAGVLIDHFAERGEPGGALALALEADGGEYAQGVIPRFYAAYSRRGLHREAAAAYKRLLDAQGHPDVNQAYFYGAFYLKSLAQSDGGIPPQALAGLLDRLAVSPRVVEYLGINLLKLGVYDAAYETFKRRFEISPQRRDIEVMMMALARRLGDLQRDRSEILERLAQSGADAWIDTRVHYLLGDLEEDALLPYANTPNRRCEVLYLLGAVRAESGDPAGGIPLLAAALATGAHRNVEIVYAHEMLERFGG
ncbi:tetratricopeptide repeat protein [Endothiovibrio diazotrophicus]